MKHVASVISGRIIGLVVGVTMLVAVCGAPGVPVDAGSPPAVRPTDAAVMTVASWCPRYRPRHSGHKKDGRRRCVGPGYGSGQGGGSGYGLPGTVLLTPPATGIVTFGNGPRGPVTTFGQNPGADLRPGTGPFGNLGGR
jgi:hypothetical protein